MSTGHPYTDGYAPVGFSYAFAADSNMSMTVDASGSAIATIPAEEVYVNDEVATGVYISQTIWFTASSLFTQSASAGSESLPQLHWLPTPERFEETTMLGHD